MAIDQAALTDFLDTARNYYPQDQHLGNRALVKKYAGPGGAMRQTFPSVGALYDKYEKPSLGEEAGIGLERGWEITKAMGHGLAALGGDVIGAEGFRQSMLSGYRENLERANELKTTVDFSTAYNTGRVADYAQWAAGGLGELVPNIAVTMGTGVLAGLGRRAVLKMSDKALLKYASIARHPSTQRLLIGTPAVNNLVKKHGEKKAATILRDMSENLPVLTGGQSLTSAGQASYTTAGLASSSIGMNTGEIYGGVAADPDVDQSNVTRGERIGYGTSLGIVAGLLDTVTQSRLTNAILGKAPSRQAKAEVKERLVRSLSKVIENVGAEAVTEGTQEALAEWAKHLSDESKVFDPEQFFHIVREAAALGALGGLAFGSAGAVTEMYKSGQTGTPTEAPAVDDDFSFKPPPFEPDVTGPGIAADPAKLTEAEQGENKRHAYEIFMHLLEKSKKSGIDSLDDMEREHLSRWSVELMEDDEYKVFVNAALDEEQSLFWVGWPSESEDGIRKQTSRVKVLVEDGKLPKTGAFDIVSPDQELEEGRQFRTARLDIQGDVRSVKLSAEQFEAARNEPHKVLDKGFDIIYTVGEGGTRVSLLNPKKLKDLNVLQGAARRKPQEARQIEALLGESTVANQTLMEAGNALETAEASGAEESVINNLKLAQAGAAAEVARLNSEMAAVNKKPKNKGFGWSELEVELREVWGDDIITLLNEGRATHSQARTHIQEVMEKQTFQADLSKKGLGKAKMSATVRTAEEQLTHMIANNRSVPAHIAQSLLDLEDVPAMLIVSGAQARKFEKRGKRSKWKKDDLFLFDAQAKKLHPVLRSDLQEALYPAPSIEMVDRIYASVVAEFSEAVMKDSFDNVVTIDWANRSLKMDIRLKDGQVRRSTTLLDQRGFTKEQRALVYEKFFEEYPNGFDEEALATIRLAPLPPDMAANAVNDIFPGSENEAKRARVLQNLGATGVDPGLSNYLSDKTEADLEYNREQRKAISEHITQLSNLSKEVSKLVEAEWSAEDVAKLKAYIGTSMTPDFFDNIQHSALFEVWAGISAQEDKAVFKTDFLAGLKKLTEALVLDSAMLDQDNMEFREEALVNSWLTNTPPTTKKMSPDARTLWENHGITITDGASETVGMKLTMRLVDAKIILQEAVLKGEGFSHGDIVDLGRQAYDAQVQMAESQLTYFVSLLDAFETQAKGWTTLLEQGGTITLDGKKVTVTPLAKSSANLPNLFNLLDGTDALREILPQIDKMELLRKKITDLQKILDPRADGSYAAESQFAEDRKLPNIYDLDGLVTRLAIAPHTETYWKAEYWTKYMDTMSFARRPMTDSAEHLQYRQRLVDFFSFIKKGQESGYLIDIQTVRATGRLDEMINDVTHSIVQLQHLIHPKHFPPAQWDRIQSHFQNGSPLNLIDLRAFRKVKLIEENLGGYSEEHAPAMVEYLESYFGQDIEQSDVDSRINSILVQHLNAPMDLLGSMWRQVNFLNSLKNADINDIAAQQTLGDTTLNPSAFRLLLGLEMSPDLEKQFTKDGVGLAQEFIKLGEGGLADSATLVNKNSAQSPTAVVVKDDDTGGYRLMTAYRSEESVGGVMEPVSAIHVPSQAAAARKAMAILKSWQEKGFITVPTWVNEKWIRENIKVRSREDVEQGKAFMVRDLMSKFTPADLPADYAKTLQLGMYRYDLSSYDDVQRPLHEALIREHHTRVSTLQRAKDEIKYGKNDDGTPDPRKLKSLGARTFSWSWERMEAVADLASLEIGTINEWVERVMPDLTKEEKQSETEGRSAAWDYEREESIATTDYLGGEVVIYKGKYYVAVKPHNAQAHTAPGNTKFWKPFTGEVEGSSYLKGEQNYRYHADPNEATQAVDANERMKEAWKTELTALEGKPELAKGRRKKKAGVKGAGYPLLEKAKTANGPSMAFVQAQFRRLFDWSEEQVEETFDSKMIDFESQEAIPEKSKRIRSYGINNRLNLDALDESAQELADAMDISYNPLMTRSLIAFFSAYSPNENGYSSIPRISEDLLKQGFMEKKGNMVRITRPGLAFVSALFDSTNGKYATSVGTSDAFQSELGEQEETPPAGVRDSISRSLSSVLSEFDNFIARTGRVNQLNMLLAHVKGARVEGANREARVGGIDVRRVEEVGTPVKPSELEELSPYFGKNGRKQIAYFPTEVIKDLSQEEVAGDAKRVVEKLRRGQIWVPSLLGGSRWKQTDQPLIDPDFDKDAEGNLLPEFAEFDKDVHESEEYYRDLVSAYLEVIQAALDPSHQFVKDKRVPPKETPDFRVIKPDFHIYDNSGKPVVIRFTEEGQGGFLLRDLVKGVGFNPALLATNEDGKLGVRGSLSKAGNIGIVEGFMKFLVPIPSLNLPVTKAQFIKLFDSFEKVSTLQADSQFVGGLKTLMTAPEIDGKVNGVVRFGDKSTIAPTLLRALELLSEWIQLRAPKMTHEDDSSASAMDRQVKDAALLALLKVPGTRAGVNLDLLKMGVEAKSTRRSRDIFIIESFLSADKNRERFFQHQGHAVSRDALLDAVGFVGQGDRKSMTPRAMALRLAEVIGFFKDDPGSTAGKSPLAWNLRRAFQEEHGLITEEVWDKTHNVLGREGYVLQSPDYTFTPGEKVGKHSREDFLRLFVKQLFENHLNLTGVLPRKMDVAGVTYYINPKKKDKLTKGVPFYLDQGQIEMAKSDEVARYFQERVTRSPKYVNVFSQASPGVRAQVERIAELDLLILDRKKRDKRTQSQESERGLLQAQVLNSRDNHAKIGLFHEQKRNLNNLKRRNNPDQLADIESQIRSLDTKIRAAQQSIQEYYLPEIDKWISNLISAGTRRMEADQSSLDELLSKAGDAVELEEAQDFESKRGLSQSETSLVTAAFRTEEAYLGKVTSDFSKDASIVQRQIDSGDRNSFSGLGTLFPMELQRDLYRQLERSTAFHKGPEGYRDDVLKLKERVRKEVEKFFSDVTLDGTLSPTPGMRALCRASVRIFSNYQKEWRNNKAFMLALETGQLTNTHPFKKQFDSFLAVTREKFVDFFTNAAVESRNTSVKGGSAKHLIRALDVLGLESTAYLALDPEPAVAAIKNALITSARYSGAANPMHIAAATFILRMDAFVPESRGYSSEALMAAAGTMMGPVTPTEITAAKAHDAAALAELNQLVAGSFVPKFEEEVAKLKEGDQTDPQVQSGLRQAQASLEYHKLLAAQHLIKRNRLETEMGQRARLQYRGGLPQPVLEALDMIDPNMRGLNGSLGRHLKSNVSSILKWNFREPVEKDNFFVGGYFRDDTAPQEAFYRDGQPMGGAAYVPNYEQESEKALRSGPDFAVPEWVPVEWLEQNQPDLTNLDWDLVDPHTRAAALANGEFSLETPGEWVSQGRDLVDVSGRDPVTKLMPGEISEAEWTRKNFPFSNLVTTISSSMDPEDIGAKVTPVFITPDGTVFQGGPHEGFGSERKEKSVIEAFLSAGYGQPGHESGFVRRLSWEEWAENINFYEPAALSGRFAYLANSAAKGEEVSSGLAKIRYLAIGPGNSTLGAMPGGVLVVNENTLTDTLQGNITPSSLELGQKYETKGGKTVTYRGMKNMHTSRGDINRATFRDPRGEDGEGTVRNPDALSDADHRAKNPAQQTHMFTEQVDGPLVLDWTKISQAGFFQGNAYNKNGRIYVRSNLFPVSHTITQPTESDVVRTKMEAPGGPMIVSTPLIEVNFEWMDKEEMEANYLRLLAPLHQMEKKLNKDFANQTTQADLQKNAEALDEEMVELEKKIEKQFHGGRKLNSTAIKSVHAMNVKLQRLRDQRHGATSTPEAQATKIPHHLRVRAQVQSVFSEINNAEIKQEDLTSQDARVQFYESFNRNYLNYIDTTHIHGTRVSPSGKIFLNMGLKWADGETTFNTFMDGMDALLTDPGFDNNWSEYQHVVEIVTKMEALGEDYSHTGVVNRDDLGNLLEKLFYIKRNGDFVHSQHFPGLPYGLEEVTYGHFLKSYLTSVISKTSLTARLQADRGRIIQGWAGGLNSIAGEVLEAYMVMHRNDMTSAFGREVEKIIEEQEYRSRGTGENPEALNMKVHRQSGQVVDLGINQMAVNSGPSSTPRHGIIVPIQEGPPQSSGTPVGNPTITLEEALTPDQRGALFVQIEHLAKSFNPSVLLDVHNALLKSNITLPSISFPSSWANNGEILESHRAAVDKLQYDHGVAMAKQINAIASEVTTKTFGIGLTAVSEDFIGASGTGSRYDPLGGPSPLRTQFKVTPVASFGTPDAVLTKKFMRISSDGNRDNIVGGTNFIPDPTWRRNRPGLRILGPVRTGNSREAVEAYVSSSPTGTSWTRAVSQWFLDIDDLVKNAVQMKPGMEGAPGMLGGTPFVQVPDFSEAMTGLAYRVAVDETGEMVVTEGAEIVGKMKDYDQMSIIMDASEHVVSTGSRYGLPGYSYHAGVFTSARGGEETLPHEVQHSFTSVFTDVFGELSQRAKLHPELRGAMRDLFNVYTEAKRAFSKGKILPHPSMIDPSEREANEINRGKYNYAFTNLQEFASAIMTDVDFLNDLGKLDGLKDIKTKGLIKRFFEAFFRLVEGILNLPKGSLGEQALELTLDFVTQSVQQHMRGGWVKSGLERNLSDTEARSLVEEQLTKNSILMPPSAPDGQVAPLLPPAYRGTNFQLITSENDSFEDPGVGDISAGRSENVKTIAENRQKMTELSEISEELKIPFDLLLEVWNLTGRKDPRNIINDELAADPSVEAEAFLGKMSPSNTEATNLKLQKFWTGLLRKLENKRFKLKKDFDEKEQSLQDLEEDQTLIHAEGYKDAERLIGSIRRRVTRLLKLAEGKAKLEGITESLSIQGTDLEELQEELGEGFHKQLGDRLLDIRDGKISWEYFQAVSKLSIDWAADGIREIKAKIREPDASKLSTEDLARIKSLNQPDNRALKALLVSFLKRERDLVTMFRLRGERSMKKVRKFQARVEALSSGMEDYEEARRSLLEDLSKGEIKESGRLILQYVEKGTLLRATRKKVEEAENFFEYYDKGEELVVAKVEEYDSRIGVLGEYALIDLQGATGKYVVLKPETLEEGARPLVLADPAREGSEWVELPNRAVAYRRTLGDDGKPSKAPKYLAEVNVEAKDEGARKKFVNDIAGNALWLELNPQLKGTTTYVQVQSMVDKLKHLQLRREHFEVDANFWMKLLEAPIQSLRRTGTAAGTELVRRLLEYQNLILNHSTEVKALAGKHGKLMREVVEAAGFEGKINRFRRLVYSPVVIGLQREPGIVSPEAALKWSRKHTESIVFLKLDKDRAAFDRFEKAFLKVLEEEARHGKFWNKLRQDAGLAVERKGSFLIDPLSGLISVFKGEAVHKGIITSPLRLARQRANNDRNWLVHDPATGTVARSDAFIQALTAPQTEKENPLKHLGNALDPATGLGNFERLLTPEVWNILIKPLLEEFVHKNPFGILNFSGTVFAGTVEMPVSVWLTTLTDRNGNRINPLATPISSLSDLYTQMVGEGAVVENEDGSMEWNDGVDVGQLGRFVRAVARLSEQHAPTEGEGKISMSERMAGVMAPVKNQWKILADLHRNSQTARDGSSFNPQAGHFIVDARTNPWISEKYFDTSETDEVGMSISLRRLAMIKAFGRDSEEAIGLFITMEKQLEDRLQRMEGPTGEFKDSKEVVKYQKFVRNLKDAKSGVRKRLERVFTGNVGELADVPGFLEATGLVVQGTLAGPRSMIVQLQSMTDLPFLMGGFSRESWRAFTNSVKTGVKSGLGDWLRVVVPDLWALSQEEQYMKDLIFQSQYENLKWDEYNAETGFMDAYDSKNPLIKVNTQRMFRGASRFLNQSGRSGFNLGQPGSHLITPFNGFKIFSKNVALGNAVGLMSAYNGVVDDVIRYFKTNPEAANDASFNFIENKKAFNKVFGTRAPGATSDGALMLLHKSHEYLGVTVEEVAKSRMNSSDPKKMDTRLLNGLVMMANNEISGEGGINTRPHWSKSSGWGQLASVITGWGLWKTARVAEELRGQSQGRGRKAGTASMTIEGARFLKNIMMVALPASWLWGAGLDWWDEKIRGKSPYKPRGLYGIRGALSRLDRSGSLGMHATWLSGLVNWTDPTSGIGRGMIAERVFVLSMLNTLQQGLRTVIAQEGATDLAQVARMTPGAGGALQYVQMANNVAAKMGWEPLSVAEYGNTVKTNARRYITSVGADLGFEMTKPGGGVYMPTAKSFHVNRMWQAAVADSPELFQDAYRSALKKAFESYEGEYKKSVAWEKAKASVILSWKSRDPLRAPFRFAPDHRDLRMVLNSLGEFERSQIKIAANMHKKYANFIKK